MRPWEVAAMALVLVLASTPAVALPGPSPGPFLPREPIVIDRDSNFTAANGVVGGDGTAGNPFVISGWQITATKTAIHVYNVTANFTIRDNSIEGKIGVRINSTTSVGVVLNNKFVVREVGVQVTAPTRSSSTTASSAAPPGPSSAASTSPRATRASKATRSSTSRTASTPTAAAHRSSATTCTTT
jgi:hypothetical protein